MSIAEIPQLFGVGKAQELTRLEQGHINETYIAICGGRKYVLQSLNEEVFHDPDAVMENIRRICAVFEQEGGISCAAAVLSGECTILPRNAAAAISS